MTTTASATEEPVLVRCFGLPDDKVKDVGKRATVLVPKAPPIRWEERPSVTIFNDKVGRWQTFGLVDFVSPCPVCDKLMRVQAIWGTTYLACCSQGCYDSFLSEHKDKYRTREAEEA